MESEVKLDFNPFNKNEEEYKNNPALVGLAQVMAHKRFESEVNRSVATDMGTLFVKRTQFSTHEEIFPESDFDAFYEVLEEQYEDELFSHEEKKSILGFGKKGNGEHVDNSAKNFD